MSIAVGVDLQPIDEVEESLREFGERYTRLLYTSNEMQGLSADPRDAARELAMYFAVKEAVLKVLQPGNDIPSWLDIEVRQGVDEGVSITLKGLAEKIALQQGCTNLTVSVVHTKDCAAVVVVAQKSNDESERSQ